MKSISCSAYSYKALDVLSCDTKTAKPDAAKLKADDVLVEVHASSINFTDRVFMTGEPWLARLAFGLFKPSYRPGCDFSGHVVAVGAKVTDHKVGDAVFGDCGGCGFSAWSEYVVANQKTTAAKPSNLTFLEAACIPAAGTVALQAVKTYGKVKAGDSVMINGAGGGVGHFALQISKALGAKSVAAYTSSMGGKMDQVKELGADKVFDYKVTDFATQGSTYDLVIDCHAYRSIYDVKKTLHAADGRYVHAGGSLLRSLDIMLRGPWIRNKGQSMSSFLVMGNKPDLQLLCKLAEEGSVKPHIAATVDGLEGVPRAMNEFMMNSGASAAGKIAIAVSDKAHLKI